MLLRFLVKLVRVAARAILLPLDALRVEPLVLRGEVVAVLAVAAGEDDLVAWHDETRDWELGTRDRGPPRSAPSPAGTVRCSDLGFRTRGPGSGSVRSQSPVPGPESLRALLQDLGDDA